METQAGHLMACDLIHHQATKVASTLTYAFVHAVPAASVARDARLRHRPADRPHFTDLPPPEVPHAEH